MHTPPSLPAGLRRRLLGIAMALPLIAVGIVAAPVSATTSTSAADTGITVEGRYNAAGAGCHGSDNADGCLSWRVRVPSTVAPNASTTVTIEADSVPGQWTWTCPSPDGDRVAGTSAFYIDKGKDEPASKLADSGLGFFDHLYYNQNGDSAGSVTAVSCTPEHLSLTYEVDFTTWNQSSYLDLDLGTTVVAPGADARGYTFSPKITTSAAHTHRHGAEAGCQRSSRHRVHQGGRSRRCRQGRFPLHHDSEERLGHTPVGLHHRHLAQ